jgi:hypothetical protein
MALGITIQAVAAITSDDQPGMKYTLVARGRQSSGKPPDRKLKSCSAL